MAFWQDSERPKHGAQDRWSWREIARQVSPELWQPGTPLLQPWCVAGCWQRRAAAGWVRLHPLDLEMMGDALRAEVRRLG